MSSMLNKKKELNQIERAKIPKSVQQALPIRAVYADGIFDLGSNLYSKTYSFTDINWEIADEDQKVIDFERYNEFLNALDNNSQAMITVYKRRVDRKEMERKVLVPEQTDPMLVVPGGDFNRMLKGKISGPSSIETNLYVTITTNRKTITDARAYFEQVTSNLWKAFNRFGSNCKPVTVEDRMKIFHDFFRPGEESFYHFDLEDTYKKGQDVRDYVCPDSLELKQTDYFKVGDKYARSLFVATFPSYVNDNILSRMTDLRKTMVFSITIQPFPTNTAQKLADDILLGINANITQWQMKQNQNNNFSAAIPYDMELQRNEASEVVGDLRQYNQKLFLATMTMVHMADSKEELDTDTDTLQSIAEGLMTSLRPLKWQQYEGMITTLPIGRRYVYMDRLLTTESLGIFMPFKAQEVFHDQGLYYGLNALSSNMLLVNRSKFNNQNAMYIGSSGGGKSFLAKMEILQMALRTNADIIILDPEREYGPLVEALGGQVIRISADSENHINAMDLDMDYGEEDTNAYFLKVQFILSLCEQISKRNDLGPKELSIIDRCVRYVYNDYRDRGVASEPPTMRELVAKLHDQPEDESHDIALILELFVNGSLNTFSQHTNVDTSNRIICYDTQDLTDQLRPVGMLVVMDSIWNRTVKNRREGKETRIFADELYLFFRYNASAEFFQTLWKRARKYNAACVGVSQNIDEIMQNDYSRQMLQNSDFIVMTNQAPKDREVLEQMINLTPEQVRYITDVEPGRGLLKAGNAYIPFINEFPRNNPLYKLLSTKPGEVI